MFIEMSREADLYFPLHVDAVSNLKRSDWPLWLMDQESLESAKEVYLENNVSVEGEFSCHTLKFNPNSIGKVVQSLKKLDMKLIPSSILGHKKLFLCSKKFLTLTTDLMNQLRYLSRINKVS